MFYISDNLSTKLLKYLYFIVNMKMKIHKSVIGKINSMKDQIIGKGMYLMQLIINFYFN